MSPQPRVRPATGKVRLDALLVERGLAESPEKAQAVILAGHVLVNEQKVEKCGASVAADARLRLLAKPMRYVSRGGLKLEDALEHFRIDARGRVALDIGASTGGFTDCLLQRGAARVIAVDVGRDQLDWKLRCDPRVVPLLGVNARYLTLQQTGERADLATVDVSFISATLVASVLPRLLAPRADVLVLVKPQFEAARGRVGKGGIVRDAAVQQEAIAKVSRKLVELGFEQVAEHESALPGAEGNREFFLHAVWKRTG